jgi:hypothetical protein
MNGRVYDPTLGRFTSPDPFIQYADNPQSYNRYSYVLNNPLSFTDPSGYFLGKLFKKIFRAVKKLVKAVVRVVKSFLKNPEQLVALGIGFITPVAWANLTGSMFGAAGTFGAAFSKGFASGLVASKGDLDDAFIGGLTAGAFHQVGSEFAGKTMDVREWAKKSIAHGAVGGVSSTIRGGDFASGFLSAGVATASMPILERQNLNFGGNLVATTVIGGSVSEIAGGEFANGAVTAAFRYLFNDCHHGTNCLNSADRQPGDVDVHVGNGNYVWVNPMDAARVACAGAVGGGMCGQPAQFHAPKFSNHDVAAVYNAAGDAFGIGAAGAYALGLIPTAVGLSGLSAASVGIGYTYEFQDPTGFGISTAIDVISHDVPPQYQPLIEALKPIINRYRDWPTNGR